MRFRTAVAAALVCLLAAMQSAMATDAGRKVILHLRWDHQFQFAGFYAAMWQGYYRNVGLDVEIRPAFDQHGAFHSAIDAVANGEAEFGIGAADVLTAVDAGKPLTVVMPVFQQSPFAFYARKSAGISSPADLVGRSVATRGSDGVAYPELRAMLKAEGIDPDSVATNEAEANPAVLELLDGRAEIAAGSVLSTGWIAGRAGVELTALRPASYGVDFYGDSVFVRRDFLKDHSDVVRKFVEASIRGWQYALTRSDEVAARMSTELTRTIPLDDDTAFNRFQIAQVKELTRFPATPLGHINFDRWRLMHQMLADAGLVKKPYDPHSVYSIAPAGFSIPEWALPAFIFAIAAMNLGLIWLLVRLKNSNAEQRAAQGARDTLQAQLRAFIDHAPVAISLRDRDGRYLAVNSKWLAFTGRHDRDVLGKRTDELVKPGEANASLVTMDHALFQQTLAGEVTTNVDSEITSTLGVTIPVAASRFPIRNTAGEVIAVGSIMQSLAELQQTVRERAKMEAQLRAFAENAPVAIAIRDLSGRYLAVNPKWESYTGYAGVEVAGKAPWELNIPVAHPNAAVVQRDRDMFAEAIRQQSTMTYETEIAHRDGTVIPVSLTRFPIRDADGTIISLGTIIQSLAELHRMHRERAEVEAQLRAFIDHAPYIFTLRDTEGRYLIANRLWETWSGLREADVKGKAPWEFITSPGNVRYEVVRTGKERLAEVVETGEPIYYESVEPDHSGVTAPMAITRFPLRDTSGKIVAVGTIAQDRSEIDRLIRARLVSETRYRNLVESSPEAILVHDKGAILYANAVAKRWMEQSGTAFEIGSLLVDKVDASDAEAIDRQIASLAHDDTTILRKEFKFRLADGSDIQVSITSSPIEFDGRQARQLVFHDVSERKRMEAQLTQNAKLATIGELSAGILHELAQPLNIARMAAQAALRKIRRGNGVLEDSAPQLELIDNQMARMAGVIDHMRVFSRTDEAIDEVFDARNAVRSAVQLIKPSFASENVAIEIDLPTRRAMIKGRSIALEQVVLNLLTNAKDAIVQNSPTGGRIEVALRIETGSGRVCVTVTDTGGGIPKHVFHRLFDPFFTTKPVGRGTGLGLPVCQSIVRAMAGEMKAENVAGGAMFTVELPLLSSAPAAVTHEEPATAALQTTAPAPGIGRTVLVVDDEPEALELMADFFEELGFDVRTASNGEEGIRAFRGDPADLLVTDIRLPVFDGIELAQMVRTRAVGVPVIFVTGHMGLTDRFDILGPRDNVKLLHKPIDLDVLERTVAELLPVNTEVLGASTKN